MGLLSKLRNKESAELGEASGGGRFLKLHKILQRAHKLVKTGRNPTAGSQQSVRETESALGHLGSQKQLITARKVWLFRKGTQKDGESRLTLRSITKRDSIDGLESTGNSSSVNFTAAAALNKNLEAILDYHDADNEERMKKIQLPRILRRSTKCDLNVSKRRSKRLQRNVSLKRNTNKGIRQISATFSSFREETQQSLERQHSQVGKVVLESEHIPFQPQFVETNQAACSASFVQFLTEEQKASGEWKSESLEKLLPVASFAEPERKMTFIKDLEVRISKFDPEERLLKKLKSKLFLNRARVHVMLGETAISTHAPAAEFPQHVNYFDIKEVMRHVGPQHQSNVVYLTLSDGVTYTIKTSTHYQREQWVQWLHCRMILLRCKQILQRDVEQETKHQAIQRLVDYVMAVPFKNEELISAVVDLLSPLLKPDIDDRLLRIVSPLLTTAPPSEEMYGFFSAYCHERPESRLIPELLQPVVERILKRVDFSKYPSARKLVKDFFGALLSQDNGQEEILRFITSIHGYGSVCPHRRVVTNLVAVCLAALHNVFDDHKDASTPDLVWDLYGVSMLILKKMVSFVDWRPDMAAILQPVPMDQSAINSRQFLHDFAEVFYTLGTDSICEAHKPLLGVREGKDGWFDIYNPSRHDMDETITSVYVAVLTKFCTCCYERRKTFAARLDMDLIQTLSKSGIWVAHELLALALEYNMVKEHSEKAEVALTLHATEGGRAAYVNLFERVFHHRQLTGKPGELTRLSLPPRTTDSEFAEVVNSNSCGNLESVSLAFTHVTSASAEHLIRMVDLKELNLWATRIDDDGVERIAEHLEGLEELNLCETSVSDQGIRAVAALKQLKRLHLSNTKLSHDTREFLKRSLPNLTEIDDRYTPAYEERMAMMARANAASKSHM